MRYVFAFAFLLSVTSLPGVARAADAGAPAVAVMDMEPRAGATTGQAHAMTLAIVRGLRQLDVFTVLSADDVRQLLAIERGRQLLGDAEHEDLGSVRDALGARYVVAGTLTQTGAQLQLEIRLLDTGSAKVLSQKTAGPAGVPQLAREVPGLAQELAAPLLEGARGELLVRVSEEAAEVRVDDVLRGSTPMSEPVALSRGTHRLEVRKDGFIAQLRPVRIEPEQLEVQEVRLAPSPDYVNAYRSRHRRSRIGAWLLSGAAVGALAGAFALDRSVERRYQDDFLPMQAALLGTGGEGFQGASAQRYQGCLSAGRAGCTAEFTTTGARLRRDQGLTMSLLGAGLAAGGVATWLWLTGEDPNRYSKIVVAPVTGDGGTGFAFSGRY